MTWPGIVILALNTLQTIALAYIAARWKANGNGSGPKNGASHTSPRRRT